MYPIPKVAITIMFCTSCGKALVPDAQFCTGCGSVVLHRTVEEIRPRPIRRFIARFIDLLIFVPLWITLGFALLRLGAAVAIPLVAIWVFVAPFAAEAILLSTWGTTPGKWMLALRVETLDGEKLTFGQGMRRAFLVTLVGRGLYIPIVSFITHLIALSKLVKTGSAPWDEDEFRVLCSSMTKARWGVLLTFVLGATILGVFYQPPAA